jgi:D-glycero-alpha-D-manno-heptose 1-phosphate guanylyltransferase
MEAIILAGGFGKRLKSEVQDIPKPMAPINDRPFLNYLLDYLIQFKLDKIILSVFYKYKVIENYYGNFYLNTPIQYSLDDKPLGTGGAIKVALPYTNDVNIFVINGDTFFDIDLSALLNFHIQRNNDITISLKPMRNFDRYGFVETDSSGRVLSLKEKQYCNYGNIDGGIYLIKRTLFNHIENRCIFSFNDFIVKNLENLKVGSFQCDRLFIDIGIPDDYKKAQYLLSDRL